MRRLLRILLAAGCAALLAACGGPRGGAPLAGGHARYFALVPGGVVSVSPFDGSRDTLRVDAPVRSVVCMSSSYVAAFEALGRDDVVTGVSGVRFLSNPRVRERAAEVGYEAALDYEQILALRPDVVLAYGGADTEPASFARLREIGVRVLVLYDYLEEDPLARAEYIRLAGRLVGADARADETYERVCAHYESLKEKVSGPVRKVLFNEPFSGIWYVPGTDSYFARLIADAGGEVLGAGPGAASGALSLERAFLLSAQADFWLHPGWNASLQALRGHDLYGAFPVVRSGAVYNNTKRATPEGGNDYYESGAVRPDLILEDLIRIFHPEALPEGELHYYFQLSD